MQTSFKKVTFSNAQGERLAARLDFPVDGLPIAYAVFAHCFTCSKNLRAVSNISAALNQQGIAVLRFDFTGLGESEGDFADTNFSSNIEDLVAAATFLSETYQAPAILIGHSLGGAAVVQAAHALPSVKAVATIGAPYDPQHVEHLFENAKADIEAHGEAKVNLGGRPFRIKKQFLDDLESQRVHQKIRSLNRALLIFHSPVDATVGVENARMIYEAAKHPKSFVSLDDADHLLTNAHDSQYVGTVLAAWARKYVGEVQERRKHVAPDDNVVVARIGRQKYRTEVLANGFPIVADEPESVGGANLGPTPYDLLLASLGTCTAMTLRMYADRKNWPLESVAVRLTHNKVHATDSGSDKPERIDQITRTLELEGDLDDSQQSRLLEIANRCPVHRSITEGPVRVETVLADPVDEPTTLVD